MMRFIHIRRFADHFRRSERGIAFLEFALALPILLLLFIGVIEVSRYLIFRMKLEAAGIQALDIIGQNINVDDVALQNMIEALPPMMLPFDNMNMDVIITHAARPSHPDRTCKAVTMWKYPAGARSKISTGRYAPIETGQINLFPNDSIMAIEITADYRPVVDALFIGSLIGSLDSRVYTLGYTHVRYITFRLDPVTGKRLDPPCI